MEPPVSTPQQGTEGAADPGAAQQEVLRAIPTSTLMMGACACLDEGCDGPDKSRRWFDTSVPVQGHVDYFLSHCWQDTRVDKALALMLYCSRTGIVVCTSLVVLITAALQYLRLVPMPSYTFHIDGVVSTNGISCCIIGCITWCLFLLFVPRLSCHKRWFLDKACISQCDEVLKQRGIRSLGNFLERSDKMVLLLSPNYFRRGWCTFEVATFLATNRLNSLEIVPLLSARLTASTFGVSVFGLTVFHVSTALGLNEAVASFIPQPTFLGLSMSTFLVWMAPTGLVLGCVATLLGRYLEEQEVILGQIAGFRFSSAEFRDETDHPFVQEVIVRLFGSVAEFEEQVHTRVLGKVAAYLGDNRQPLRFQAIVAGTLPWAWWGLDMACTDPPRYKLSDLVLGACTAFSFLPALFAMLAGLEKAKLACLREAPASLRVTADVMAVLLAAGLSTVLMGVTLEIEVFGPLVAKLAVWLFWTAVAAAYFFPHVPHQALFPRPASREKSREMAELLPCEDFFSL